jgi:hypothetical protein
MTADEFPQTQTMSTQTQNNVNITNENNAALTTADNNNKEVSKNQLKVLFLCTGNSCRSQMGEGLLRDMALKNEKLAAKYEFVVFSAGVKPLKVGRKT